MEQYPLQISALTSHKTHINKKKLRTNINNKIKSRDKNVAISIHRKF